jgi:2-polyprenyl-3-methyl-5-hydroxy-6-metoxy-1,4-benzoquinol methylase
MDNKLTENIKNLVEHIKTLNKFQKGSIDSTVAMLSDEEIQLFDSYIKHFISTGVTIEFLAESYDLFVKETNKEQFYFLRHKKYRYSSFKEVAELVYFNKEYMKKYMHGIAVTLFLWPSHIEMRRYFEKMIPKNKNGKYLEVAAGHGLHFMRAMRLANYDLYEGIDISPTSVAMTEAVLADKTFGGFSHEKYRIRECDFFKMDSNEKYDAVVAGEVIEHIEDAVGFLKKIGSLSKDDGFMFVTTCINAPEPDHIFLFNSLKHLDEIVDQASMRIKDSLVVPYIGVTIEEAEKKLLPINIAMVLEKK